MPRAPSPQTSSSAGTKSTLLRGLRLLTSHHRTAGADRALATVLAVIAGAANAGGFIMLGSYTSHMTGYLSALADNIVLQNLALVGKSLLAISMFVAGAAASAIVINWAREHLRRQQYSLPVTLQGGLLLALAALHSIDLPAGMTRPLGLGLLCFIMGFQNATITKISYARIRTTHATGMITDVGIELGRTIYGHAFGSKLRADRAKLAILIQLLLSFLLGGIAGALGYSVMGVLFSVPLAAVLLVLAWI